MLETTEEQPSVCGGHSFSYTSAVGTVWAGAKVSGGGGGTVWQRWTKHTKTQKGEGNIE